MIILKNYFILIQYIDWPKIFILNYYFYMCMFPYWSELQKLIIELIKYNKKHYIEYLHLYGSYLNFTVNLKIILVNFGQYFQNSN